MTDIKYNHKMDKEIFIKMIALRTGDTTGNVLRHVNAALGVIGELMARKEILVLPDFGKFYVKRIPEKTTARGDGEVVIVPEHDKVSFAPYRNITVYSDKYKG